MSAVKKTKEWENEKCSMSDSADDEQATTNSDDEENRKEGDEPPLKIGDIVDNQFKVVQILGQGGFGAVFEVLDTRKNTNYALKIELKLPDPEEPGLNLEIDVLRRMQRNKHFPRFIHGGKHRGLIYLVMQLLGENLVYLRKKCPGKRFTVNTSVQLALQTLECVEAMHKADLLHRDIKPENFVTGRTSVDKRIIYMLDFGMVRRFRIKGKVRPARPIAAFRGTITYASPSVLNNGDAGRCDDMFSWLYVVIEFFKGSLPWYAERTNRRRMLELKRSMVKELLAATPLEIQAIYGMLAKLNYADDPPCDTIRHLLDQIRQRVRGKDSDPFDWESGGAYYGAVFSKLEDKRRKIKFRKETAAEEVQKSRRDDLTMKTFVLDD